MLEQDAYSCSDANMYGVINTCNFPSIQTEVHAKQANMILPKQPYILKEEIE